MMKILDRHERHRSATETIERLVAENLALKGVVGELSERLRRMEALADTDTLTPLVNRRAFERELDRVIRRAARYGTPAALLFVDLNGLKAINDGHGHGTGDQALVHVAGLLADNVRASDLPARIGGDEFGIILDNVDEAAAREKAAALEALVAAAPLPNGIRVSVSIGVTALVPRETRAAAIDRADADMYRGRRMVRRS